MGQNAINFNTKPNPVSRKYTEIMERMRFSSNVCQNTRKAQSRLTELYDSLVINWGIAYITSYEASMILNQIRYYEGNHKGVPSCTLKYLLGLKKSGATGYSEFDFTANQNVDDGNFTRKFNRNTGVYEFHQNELEEFEGVKVKEREEERRTFEQTLTKNEDKQFWSDDDDDGSEGGLNLITTCLTITNEEGPELSNPFGVLDNLKQENLWEEGDEFILE